MLDLDPSKRISAKEALEHDFFLFPQSDSIDEKKKPFDNFCLHLTSNFDVSLLKETNFGSTNSVGSKTDDKLNQSNQSSKILLDSSYGSFIMGKHIPMDNFINIV